MTSQTPILPTLIPLQLRLKNLDSADWRASSFIDFPAHVGRPGTAAAALEHIREQLCRTLDGLELRHYDVWQGMEIQPEAHADFHRLTLSLKLGEAGCVVSAPADLAVALPPAPTTKPSAREGAGNDRARVTLADLTLHAAAPSDPVIDGEEPEEMCRVPGGLFRFVVRHNTSTVMEGACYGGVITTWTRTILPNTSIWPTTGWIKPK